MYTDPIELVDTITGNWHSPPTHLFDTTILPPNDPELWPHNVLTSLADLSILTAIDLDSSTGSEKFQHARDRLTDLCTYRQDQAEDYHNEQGAGVMQAMDIEAVIAELGGRQEQAKQQKPTTPQASTTIFPVARMSVAGGTRTGRDSEIRQVFSDQGQSEWEQQRRDLERQLQRDDIFSDDDGADEHGSSRHTSPSPSPSPSASRAVTPEPLPLLPDNQSHQDQRATSPARAMHTPSSPVAIATVAATTVAPAPARCIATPRPRARLLRDRKYRDLANELERLEYKATRMACLEKARVVKRKMWRIKDEKDDEAGEEIGGGSRKKKKKGRFES